MPRLLVAKRLRLSRVVMKGFSSSANFWKDFVFRLHDSRIWAISCRAAATRRGSTFGPGRRSVRERGTVEISMPRI